jgi:hypothetical protein
MRRKIESTMICAAMLITLFGIMIPTNASSPPSGMKAEIDIDPDTLNLNSRGRWITAYIEVPGNNPQDIDIATIRITEMDGIPIDIPAEPWPTEIGDGNENGIPDLMAKFSRAEIEDATGMNETVELMMTGEMQDGTPWWDMPRFDQKYRLRERFALICVSANDFWPQEANETEMNETEWGGMGPDLIMQDRDGFPAAGLLAYYELRDHLGYKDSNIIFMLWHDDEPGNTKCEKNQQGKWIDDDDGEDEWISIFGNNNHLHGPDGIQGNQDDPVIDVDNKQVTKDRLETEITVTLENMISNAQWSADVLIYLVGHGGVPNPSKPKEAAYYFEAGDSTPSGKDDYVTEKELSQWLNQISCYRMTILIDTCYAENIISSQIQGQRILVGASGHDIKAKFWMEARTSPKLFAGSWFFNPFWSALGNDKTIKQAYNAGWFYILYSYMIDPGPPPVFLVVIVGLVQQPVLIDKIGDADSYKP